MKYFKTVICLKSNEMVMTTLLVCKISLKTYEKLFNIIYLFHKHACFLLFILLNM